MANLNSVYYSFAIFRVFLFLIMFKGQLQDFDSIFKARTEKNYTFFMVCITKTLDIRWGWPSF